MNRTPEVHVMIDEPNEVLPGHVLARCAEGVDAVEIRFRFDGESGPKKTLRLLAKACLEILVRAREIDGTHAPAQVASREAEGARWNG